MGSGPYGIGERISIKNTRNCIDAILDNSIQEAEFNKDQIFGFEIPKQLSNVDAEICNPILAWDNEENYNAQSNKLATMFKENYIQYISPGFTNYSEFGPK